MHELCDVAGSFAILESHRYDCALVLAQRPTICIYLLLEIVRVLRINVLLRRCACMYSACIFLSVLLGHNILHATCMVLSLYKLLANHTQFMVIIKIC